MHTKNKNQTKVNTNPLLEKAIVVNSIDNFVYTKGNAPKENIIYIYR